MQLKTTVPSWRHWYRIRLRKPYRLKKQVWSEIDVEVLGFSLFPFQKWKEIRRYVWLIRSDITSTHPVSSLVQDWMGCLHPLHLKWNWWKWNKINHEGNRMQHMETAAEHRGFTSFQMVHTHTHTPGRSRVNPERQEEEKSGHTKGKRPKTEQGGKGNGRTSRTNLHGETDLTQDSAHT